MYTLGLPFRFPLRIPNPQSAIRDPQFEKIALPRASYPFSGNVSIDTDDAQTVLAPGQAAQRPRLRRDAPLGGREQAAHGLSERPVPESRRVLVARHGD